MVHAVVRRRGSVDADVRGCISAIEMAVVHCGRHARTQCVVAGGPALRGSAPRRRARLGRQTAGVAGAHSTPRECAVRRAAPRSCDALRVVRCDARVEGRAPTVLRSNASRQGCRKCQLWFRIVAEMRAENIEQQSLELRRTQSLIGNRTVK